MTPTVTYRTRMSEADWGEEFANQQLDKMELRVLALVAAVGPLTTDRIAEVAGRTDREARRRQWQAIQDLARMRLIAESSRGWLLTTRLMEARQ